MSWIDKVRERRSINKMDLWGKDIPYGDEVDSGVEVSESTALQLIAVNRCIRLLSETVAALPDDAFRMKGEEREPVPRRPSWLDFPNPETTWFEFAERIMSSLNTDGNAFVLISARDATGYPSELWTLNPGEVVVRRERNETRYIWSGTDVLTRYGPTTPAGDVLHIKGFNVGGLRGLSPIAYARQGIGLGIVTEKFGSKFFGKGTHLSGVISLPPADKVKTNEFIAQMKSFWQDSHGGPKMSHLPGVMTGGATWTPISIPPEDAQFLETRKFQVEEIARMYGVPPHMIGHTEPSTSWGSGIEQMSIGFVRFSLLPWIVRLEASLSQLLPRGQFVKLNVSGLLRGDAAAQAAAFASAIQNGYMSRSEVRRLLELPHEGELDPFLLPLNLGTVGAPPAPVPAGLDQSGEPTSNGKVTTPVPP